MKELEAEKERLKQEAAEKRRQKALRSSVTNPAAKPDTQDLQQPGVLESMPSQEDLKESETKNLGEQQEAPKPKQTLRSIAVPVKEDRDNPQQHSEFTSQL